MLTVGVNVELDLHLGHAAGRGRDAIQAEGAQGLVVASKLTLALRPGRGWEADAAARH